jgi:hypothetical protein
VTSKTWPPHNKASSRRHRRFLFRPHDPWQGHTITFNPTVICLDRSIDEVMIENCGCCKHGHEEDRYIRCLRYHTFPLTRRCVCGEFEGQS